MKVGLKWVENEKGKTLSISDNFIEWLKNNNIPYKIEVNKPWEFDVYYEKLFICCKCCNKVVSTFEGYSDILKSSDIYCRSCAEELKSSVPQNYLVTGLPEIYTQNHEQISIKVCEDSIQEVKIQTNFPLINYDKPVYIDKDLKRFFNVGVGKAYDKDGNSLGRKVIKIFLPKENRQVE